VFSGLPSAEKRDLERGREWIESTALTDLVDPEPLVGGADQTGQVSLNILDVVEL